MSRLGWAALVLVCATTLAHAQPRRTHDDRDKRYSARRTNLAIRIDGRLDDAAWSAATVDGRFTQNFPDEGKPPSQKTDVRVLFDDEALYIGIRCWDSDPAGIVERLTRRDRDTDADKVTVDISSKNDHITAYHFDVNVSGVLADGVRFNDTDYSGDWDGLWLGATSRDAGGWSAELMIPLKTLRYEGGRSEFGFEVRRQIQRRQEVDEWAYKPREASGEVSYYGTLDGLGGLHATRLFQIVPYLAAGIYQRYNQSPYNGTALYGNIGGDLKLGLTSALTLDATINPDFGQVEADQVVLNLTTFEVFFPEKRPFFLEGVDIFATPIQLFYSRRIGRPPPEPNNYALNEPLPEGRIWGAVKLTGILAPRLTIGVLDALTDSSSVSASLNGAQPIRLGLQPLSNFFVLRLKRDIMEHSYVGFMATGVSRFEEPFSAAPGPGDICPDDPVAETGILPSPRLGRCYHDAYTGGVDALVLNHDSDYGVRAHVAGSAVVGGPTRLIADGTTIGAGDAGLGILANGGKIGGRLMLTARYEGYSPKFEVNDAGYNRQANVHRVNLESGWRILKPISILLEGNVFAGIVTRFSWNGDAVLQKTAYFNTWMRFRNFWTSYFEVDYDLNHDDNREARDGAIVERAGGWSVCWYGRSDPRKRLNIDGGACMSRVRWGQSFDSNYTFRVRPLPAVELDIIPHASWTFGDPRWFDTLDNGNGTRTYLFADLESREFDTTLRGTYTFTPTLTLQAYAQLFIDGGHYGQTYSAIGHGKGTRLPFSAFTASGRPAYEAPDFRDGAINLNVVLRWEFQPGSTILGVYTHAQTQTDYDPNEGIGKPSFTRFGGGAGTDLFLVKLSLLLT
ncbi:MAG TPA: DUF5916 domain-containing protein [Polyangia bacterium]|nr:DUF5916 domain-containing protein [Polyangia bacterium]